MKFSEKCSVYISSHLCSEQTEQNVINAIKSKLPLTLASIAWSKINYKIETGRVDRMDLKCELIKILHELKLSPDDLFIIINMENAFSTLESSLTDWFCFADELNFVNTLFINKKSDFLLHWDFYEILHATRLC